MSHPVLPVSNLPSCCPSCFCSSSSSTSTSSVVHRCGGQHRSQDAPPGVRPQQEEGSGTAKPQPRRTPKRRPLLVSVSHNCLNANAKKAKKKCIKATCLSLLCVSLCLLSKKGVLAQLIGILKLYDKDLQKMSQKTTMCRIFELFEGNILLLTAFCMVT